MNKLSEWLAGRKTYLAVSGLILMTVGAFLQKGDFSAPMLWETGKNILTELIPAFLRMGIAKGVIPNK